MNKLILDYDKRYQTFENFGASGAWWAQVVGGWEEPDPSSGLPKYERIAELLFDKQKGIGIRCYRYNLGAGSDRVPGKITNVSRRAESFDTDDGGYDWSRDGNSVRMLNEAVKHGADEIILFVNSPPVSMTRNGKGHLDKALHTNLSPENYHRFAAYCLDCAEHFKNEGIPVKYISPVNEPVWVWTGGQEGCHYRPAQVYNLLKVFAEEMDKRNGLNGVKLSGAENGDLRWFNNTYAHVMLRNKNIRKYVDAVDTHSYCLMPHIPVIEKIFGNRVLFMKRYRRFMNRHYPDVNIKTSEWCHMQGGRDYGMDSALEQTKIIMEDLSILNVSSWQLWIAVSNVDYCDGLIYINEDPRTFELTKRYYAFGNFSKFVEYGSVRFGCDAGEDLNSVGFTKGNRSVVVISNRTSVEKKLELPNGTAEIYLTDESHNLDGIEVPESLCMTPKSVATLIINR